MKIIAILCFFIPFAQPGMAAERLSVFGSIVPQRYFVQQIGKNRADVQVMVQPGASAATYEPKPRQMAGISKARAYFAVGVPYGSDGPAGTRPLPQRRLPNIAEIFKAALK